MPTASMGAAILISARLFFGEALRALGRNKLRSTLASVAVTIGIAAVVCVVAIGRAGSLRSEEQLRMLGDNLVQIEAGSRAPSGVRTGSHGTNTLVMADAEAIRREMPLVKAVSPNVDGTVQVVNGNRNWRTRFRGVSPEYLGIRRFEVGEGTAFSEQDDRRAASVSLIGPTVRLQLFGDESPIGQVFRIGAQVFQVVGVLAPKGLSASGQDQDDQVVLPYTTAQSKLRGKGFNYLDDIFCSAISPQAVVPAIEEISALLRQRHHIRPGQDDDFNVRRPDEIIKVQIQTSHTIEVLLLSIASISLVVGGIGIMNVMLVTVAERTREIGLRLAVGATERHVLLQFLGEAVTLSLIGGLLGVALGVTASWVVGRALEWPMVIPPLSLILAPLFAIAVGVFFGFYPARRAAQLDPIDALRHE